MRMPFSKSTMALLVCVAILMMLIEMLDTALSAAQDRLSDEIFKVKVQYQNWLNRHGPRL